MTLLMVRVERTPLPVFVRSTVYRSSVPASKMFSFQAHAWRHRGGGRGGCVITRGSAAAPEPPPGTPSTHDAVWGRRAADETLHLAAVPTHGVLHSLARDDGGSCGR